MCDTGDVEVCDLVDLSVHQITILGVDVRLMSINITFNITFNVTTNVTINVTTNVTINVTATLLLKMFSLLVCMVLLLKWWVVGGLFGCVEKCSLLLAVQWI